MSDTLPCFLPAIEGITLTSISATVIITTISVDRALIEGLTRLDSVYTNIEMDLLITTRVIIIYLKLLIMALEIEKIIIVIISI